ncbi:MAG: phospholipase D family protein [Desulfovibrio sp.]|nr:phospholipase D family protein [Desulfovibrio sp.]
MHRFLLPAFLILSFTCSAYAAQIEVAFSPEGKAIDLVLKVINKAQKSVHVAAYHFTNGQIAQALAAAHKRGIDVRVVADKVDNSQKKKTSAVGYVVEHGIPMRLNGQYTVLHDKFLVVDGKHVQTGSFNYTIAATQKNAENVLVVWDNPMVAGQYEQEWARLWSAGEAIKLEQ